MKRIGVKSIMAVLFFIFLFFLLIISNSIIKPILISFLFAYILKPFVNMLTAKGINRRVSAFLAIIIILGILSVIFIYVIPGIASDVLGIIGNIDEYNNRISDFVNKAGYNRLPQYLKNIIGQSTSNIQNAVTDYLKSLFNRIIDFSIGIPTYILIPVFIYYFLTDSSYFVNLLKSLIPVNVRDKAVELGHEIDRITGQFIRSQILLSFIIAIMTFVVLLILKIKYPLIIALINGITNIIPYFGPVIGFIPALICASSESVNKAVIVTAAFLAIQEFESSIIAPKLIGESIGIHPVFIMVILLLGGKYFGVLGLILSVPAAGIVKVSYKYIIRNLY